MKNTNYTREEVNAAITTVLTCEYKKDAPKAFKIVEEAGYTIEKCNTKTFRIWAPVETAQESYNRKSIYLQGTRTRYNDGQVIKHYQIYLTSKSVDVVDLTVIDYVAVLDTPKNVIWEQMKNTNYWESINKSHAVNVYQNRIRHNRRMVKSYEEDIESCKKKIEELQNRMLGYMQRKTEYEQKVVEAKKELGLTR